MTKKHASVQSSLPEHGTPPAPPAKTPHQEHGTPSAPPKTERHQEHGTPHAQPKTERHQEHDTPPAQPKTEPHHDISSPAVVHANDRMKLGAKPNDGEPLAHRDRAKAGRKG